MSHSPEPWTEREFPPEVHFDGYFRILDAERRHVATVPTSTACGKPVGNGQENKARILACVNTLAGIPTEALHLFAGRMKFLLLMASEVTDVLRDESESRVLKYLYQTVELLNEAGFYWEKNT